MYSLILTVHVLLAMVLIALILIQHGKGADIGASFGSGASNTVFGSQGTAGFLFRLTTVLALLFFTTSLILSYIVASQHQQAKRTVLPIDVMPANDTIPLPALPKK